MRNAQLLGSVFLPHIPEVDHGINFAFLFVEDFHCAGYICFIIGGFIEQRFFIQPFIAFFGRKLLLVRGI